MGKEKWRKTHFNGVNNSKIIVQNDVVYSECKKIKKQNASEKTAHNVIVKHDINGTCTGREWLLHPRGTEFPSDYMIR